MALGPVEIITLRIPSDLKHHIAQAAERHDLSNNQVIVDILAVWFLPCDHPLARKAAVHNARSVHADAAVS